MNKKQVILFFIFLILIHSNVSASSITQCVQPDGTIEFTNQGCSKSNRYNSKSTYKHNSTQSLVKNTKKKSHKNSAPFRQTSFVKLQKSLIKAKSPKEAEEHAKVITEKVRSHAQKGKLKNAYDMIAATYVRLSKHIKKRQWEGLEINAQTLKIRSLFEEILITQSTISSANELTLAIENAWEKHQANY